MNGDGSRPRSVALLGSVGNRTDAVSAPPAPAEPDPGSLWSATARELRPGRISWPGTFAVRVVERPLSSAPDVIAVPLTATVALADASRGGTATLTTAVPSRSTRAATE